MTPSVCSLKQATTGFAGTVANYSKCYGEKARGCVSLGSLQGLPLYKSALGAKMGGRSGS